MIAKPRKAELDDLMERGYVPKRFYRAEMRFGRKEGGKKAGAPGYELAKFSRAPIPLTKAEFDYCTGGDE